jgi:hypothetical protein
MVDKGREERKGSVSRSSIIMALGHRDEDGRGGEEKGVVRSLRKTIAERRRKKQKKRVGGEGSEFRIAAVRSRGRLKEGIAG